MLAQPSVAISNALIYLSNLIDVTSLTMTSCRKHACDKVHLRWEIKESLPPGGDPPAQRRSHTFSTNDPGPFKRAIDMTDDELAAIASRATLHVVK